VPRAALRIAEIAAPFKGAGELLSAKAAVIADMLCALVLTDSVEKVGDEIVVALYLSICRRGGAGGFGGGV
jgi:hypothetical protein